jgi:hypothetical protein
MQVECRIRLPRPASAQIGSQTQSRRDKKEERKRLRLPISDGMDPSPP